MSLTNGNIIPHELYPTPSSVVEALLDKVTFRLVDLFLEPCRGTGAIYDKVKLPVSQKTFAEISMGVDYLTTGFDKQDVIITNPPFSLTEAFLRKSLSELTIDGTLIYLQRLNYLGSIKRIPFWAEVGFPEKISIIVPRPRFVKNRSDACEYAWFIYDRGDRVALPFGLSHLINESTTKGNANENR